MLFAASCAASTPSLQWFRNGQLTAAGTQLLIELARADERGLRASDYDAANLGVQVNRAAARGDRAALERLDVDLTAAAGHIASDLHDGRVKPSELGYDLEIKRQPFNAVAAAALLAGSSNVAATLDSMEPQLRHYALLKKALASYRSLNAAHPEVV